METERPRRKGRRSRSRRSRSRERDESWSLGNQSRPVATAGRGRSHWEMPNRWSREKPKEETWPTGAETASRQNRWNQDRDRDWEGRGRDSSWHGSGSRDSSLQPLPRPGYDRDRRLALLDDDPRYFPGAELGKAQKAAMGIKGMHGRNTASFDPRSTLVRPAMRVIYGRKGHEFGGSTKPDDVVVVPELLCDAGDLGILNRVVAELAPTKGQVDPSEVPAVKSLCARVCQYFQVDPDSASIRVRWHRAGKQPVEIASPGFRPAKGAGSCMLNLSLGATCELAFKRTKTGEILYFPQANGTLMLMGYEVVSSWLPGESKRPESEHVSITVSGRSSKAVEEEALADTVAAATKARLLGDAAFCFCSAVLRLCMG